MPKRVKRALTHRDIENMKFQDLDVSKEFQDLFGVPEASGVWIIWGHSGNGKTRFALQLLKELTKSIKNTYGKVAYDTLEEGARKSFRRAVMASYLKEVRKKLLFLNREPIEDLKIRLSKHKAPKMVFVDSFQYSGLTKRSYKHLKEEFPDVLFIFVSHAEGKHPEGRAAKFVRYDADVKIHVEGYVATAVSRYGGGKPYEIWPEKVQELQGAI